MIQFNYIHITYLQINEELYLPRARDEIERPESGKERKEEVEEVDEGGSGR